MRKEDKERKRKPKGVWIEFDPRGGVWVMPIKCSDETALAAIVELASDLADVEGMTQQ